MERDAPLIEPKFGWGLAVVAQKVNVFLIRFEQAGKRVWMRQSYDFKLANTICRQLAKEGRKPVMFRASVCPESFVASYQAKSRSFVAA